MLVINVWNLLSLKWHRVLSLFSSFLNRFLCGCLGPVAFHAILLFPLDFQDI